MDRPPGRLFLVGCPRSGTTVVQAAIGRLPGIFTLPETRWFHLLLGGFDDWSSHGGDERVRRKWRRRLAVVGQRTHRELRQAMAYAMADAPRLRRHLRGTSYVGEFVRRMDQAARRQACSHWLEKTPEHYAYIEIIRRFIPDARFIHVIRNCRDVVASAIAAQIRYADHGVFSGGIPQWVARWNRAAETHLQYAGCDGHLVMRYEDFAAAPEDWLERVRAFARIEGAPRPDASPMVADLEAEPWKRQSVNAPVCAAPSRFDDMFGTQLQDWLRQHLRDYDSVSAELRRRQHAPLLHPAAKQALELRQAVRAEERFLTPEPVR